MRACMKLVVFIGIVASMVVNTNAAPLNTDHDTMVVYSGVVEAIIGEHTTTASGVELCIMVIHIRSGAVTHDAFFLVPAPVRAEISRFICNDRYLRSVSAELQSHVEAKIWITARDFTSQEIHILRSPFVSGNWMAHQKALKFGIARVVHTINKGEDASVILHCKLLQRSSESAVPWLQSITVGNRTFVLAN